MNFKEHVTPRKGSDEKVEGINMVFRAYPMKGRDGFMLHAYADQSAIKINGPEDYAKVERSPYLTPKQNGPFVSDGAIAISGKLMDTLLEKSNCAIDPETGIVNGSMTTTMTQRNGQWQPDIAAISGKGFYQTAATHDPAKLAARVDRSINLPKEASKFYAEQKKEAQAQAGIEGEQMQIPGLEDEAKAPISDVEAAAPEVPETDMEF